MFTISEQDAAESLGMQESTLAQMRRDGKVPHIRISEKIIRYSNDNLTEIVKQFAVPAKNTSGKRRPKAK